MFKSMWDGETLQAHHAHAPASCPNKNPNNIELQRRIWHTLMHAHRHTRTCTRAQAHAHRHTRMRTPPPPPPHTPPPTCAYTHVFNTRAPTHPPTPPPLTTHTHTSCSHLTSHAQSRMHAHTYLQGACISPLLPRQLPGPADTLQHRARRGAAASPRQPPDHAR
jgi:hypothetical protein